MRTITRNFDEVSVTATKHFVDSDGKKRQKTKTFFQTLNPYNRNSDGLPKTRKEIYTEILAERDAWLKTDVHKAAQANGD